MHRKRKESSQFKIVPLNDLWVKQSPSLYQTEINKCRIDGFAIKLYSQKVINTRKWAVLKYDIVDFFSSEGKNKL